MTKIAAVTDGLSNTMMSSELRIASPGNDLRGYIWWGPSASFTALLTPNSSLQDSMGNGGCYTTLFSIPGSSTPCNTGVTNNLATPSYAMVYLAARSFHPGGITVGFCDGSVKFIKNTINPLTYQAISTTKGGEVVSSDSY